MSARWRVAWCSRVEVCEALVVPLGACFSLFGSNATSEKRKGETISDAHELF